MAAVESTITWLKVSFFIFIRQLALAGVMTPFSDPCQDPGAEASPSLPRLCKQCSGIVNPGTLLTALEARVGPCHNSPVSPALPYCCQLAGSHCRPLPSLSRQTPSHLQRTAGWLALDSSLLRYTLRRNSVFSQVEGTLLPCLYPLILRSGNLGG